ncbi:MAG: N-acetylmuramoyl-L-alanine amidase [Pseudomonadota bacterium]
MEPRSQAVSQAEGPCRDAPARGRCLGLVWVVCVLVCQVFGPAALAQDWRPSVSHTGTIAKAARLSRDGQKTVFTLITTGKVAPRVFALSRPYRVVIDIPDMRFQLPSKSGRTGAGLVARYRFGLLSPGRARIVLDLTAPVRFETRIVKSRQAETRFALELHQVAPGEFQGQRPPQLRQSVQPRKPAAPPLRQLRTRGTPIVVIDAGHGGVDPGAVASDGVLEKEITLAVAHRLRRALIDSGKVKVVMTRVNDVYVTLDNRVARAAEVRADLFISLHADSVPGESAAFARGASVYIMSEKASDRRAQLVAEKENASDTLAGVTTDVAKTSFVHTILIDLLRRESADRAIRFRDELIKGLRGSIRLHTTPRRSAAFRVLRQVSTPAVLVELGFMSHPRDRRDLVNARWQSKVADVLSAAVLSFFRGEARRRR